MQAIFFPRGLATYLYFWRFTPLGITTERVRASSAGTCRNSASFTKLLPTVISVSIFSHRSAHSQYLNRKRTIILQTFINLDAS
jgi:hypothetical protein